HVGRRHPTNLRTPWRHGTRRAVAAPSRRRDRRFRTGPRPRWLSRDVAVKGACASADRQHMEEPHSAAAPAVDPPRPTDADVVRRRLVRFAVASAVFLAIYLGWQVERWGGLEHKTLLGDLAYIPLNLAAVVTAWAASRRCRADRR